MRKTTRDALRELILNVAVSTVCGVSVGHYAKSLGIGVVAFIVVSLLYDIAKKP